MNKYFLPIVFLLFAFVASPVEAGPYDPEESSTFAQQTVLKPRYAMDAWRHAMDHSDSSDQTFSQPTQTVIAYSMYGTGHSNHCEKCKILEKRYKQRENELKRKYRNVKDAILLMHIPLGLAAVYECTIHEVPEIHTKKIVGRVGAYSLFLTFVLMVGF